MMNASLAANANRIPELPENCFYFIDTPKALRERDGAKAKDLNPKRKRPARGRSGLDRKVIPLSHAERVANLAWFYAARAATNDELSPFDE